MNQASLPHDVQNLINDQGKAYDQAVSYIKDKYRGVSVETDDYIITVVCQPAEGMYVVDLEGQMSWQPPGPDDNQHIGIIVQDRYDHRFVPELHVYCKLQDILDNFVEEKLQRFVWHPLLFHYGENWSIPGQGDYIISLTIKYPQFRRNSHTFGNRYDKDITLEFSPIQMFPQKRDTQD